MLVEDETGDMSLVFFRANQAWVEKALPLGATRWVSGLVEMFDFYKQMVHPDRIVDEAGLAALPPVEPVYGLTEGLFQRVAAKAAAAALARLPKLARMAGGAQPARQPLGKFRRQPDKTPPSAAAAGPRLGRPILDAAGL